MEIGNHRPWVIWLTMLLVWIGKNRLDLLPWGVCELQMFHLFSNTFPKSHSQCCPQKVIFIAMESNVPSHQPKLINKFNLYSTLNLRGTNIFLSFFFEKFTYRSYVICMWSINTTCVLHPCKLSFVFVLFNWSILLEDY